MATLEKKKPCGYINTRRHAEDCDDFLVKIGEETAKEEIVFRLSQYLKVLHCEVRWAVPVSRGPNHGNDSSLCKSLLDERVLVNNWR